MRSVRIVATSIVAVAVISGCASNGYQQFYTQNPYVDHSKLLPLVGEPRVFASSADPAQDAARLIEQGYELIGQASFNGPAAKPNDVLKQAKAVGAEIVLVNSHYSHTVSGTVAMPMYTPGQTVRSTTYGSASAYGTGGSAYGTYSGTTTTQLPGTTTYVPVNYNVQRFDQAAAFFGKRDPKSYILGAYWEELSAEARAQLQKNQGVEIKVVIKGTPAYRSNLFAGDIIMSADSQPVVDNASLTSFLEDHAGQTVTLGLLRKGQELAIPVAFNPPFIPIAK